MCKIIIARHGHCEFGAEDISPQGAAEMRALGKRIRELLHGRQLFLQIFLSPKRHVAACLPSLLEGIEMKTPRAWHIETVHLLGEGTREANEEAAKLLHNADGDLVLAMTHQPQRTALSLNLYRTLRIPGENRRDIPEGAPVFIDPERKRAVGLQLF